MSKKFFLTLSLILVFFLVASNASTQTSSWTTRVGNPTPTASHEPPSQVCQGTSATASFDAHFAQNGVLPTYRKFLPLPDACPLANGECGRPGVCMKPNKIIVHVTAEDSKGNPPSAKQIYDYFAKGSDGWQVGSQFVIDSYKGTEGQIWQLTEMYTDKAEIAYAAQGWNAHGINIETCSRGDLKSRNDMPPAQYKALLHLVKALMIQYDIPVGSFEYTWRSGTGEEQPNINGVFGHYQLSADKQVDPGEGFFRDFREDLKKL